MVLPIEIIMITCKQRELRKYKYNWMIWLIIVMFLSSFKCSVQKTKVTVLSLNSGSERVFFPRSGIDQNEVRDSGKVNGISGFYCYGRQDSPKFALECGMHAKNTIWRTFLSKPYKLRITNLHGLFKTESDVYSSTVEHRLCYNKFLFRFLLWYTIKWISMSYATLIRTTLLKILYPNVQQVWFLSQNS